MKTKTRQRGDVMQVVRMSAAAGLNGGKGYSFRHVYQVLNKLRKNADISALHAQLVALRTAPKRSRK